jgi:exosortase B
VTLARTLLPEEAGASHIAKAWWLAGAGFAVMYLPLYWWAFGTIWQTEEHGHGIIILAVLAWLFWNLRAPLAALPAGRSMAGWPVFALGLLTYALGRTFSISVLEFASQPLILAGGLLLLKGRPALRLAWFPIFYCIFMIPLPGILVDAVTGPLKQWISVIVVELLHALGYPIARSGVMITIGQYQMLVADACSGLHSMFSLSALGTLFMYVMRRNSWVHNAVMLAAILPIAFTANIVRVTILVLLTYHFGDEVGQGFLHGTAGMVLMLISLMLLAVLDQLVARLLPGRKTAAPTAA